ncbi:inner membrane-spanning protein YciB [Phenylobacterium sp.]|uniref:inner membrane-spanning protein YciB n=1 Tax=Phenylobacterium sp. TaxID=1871053 RepID=UPI003D2A5688
MNEQNRRGWVRYVIDFSAPLSLLISYFFFGRDFMLATGVSVVVAIIALAFGFLVERRLAWMPLIVGVLGIIFGGLTLIFQADWILKLRPTFVNYAFALIFFGGLILKKNPIKAVLGWAFSLPVEVWRTLELRYAIFSVVLGTLNLIVWMTQTEATWVTWDTIGIRVLSAAFGLAQMPLLMKHLKDAEVPPPPRTDGA